MAEGWEWTLARAKERDAEMVRAVGHWGEMNMHRYFAYLSLEAGELGTGWQLLAKGFGKAPGRFLRERRNYLLAGGLAAKAALPKAWYENLERRIRRG